MDDVLFEDELNEGEEEEEVVVENERKREEEKKKKAVKKGKQPVGATEEVEELFGSDEESGSLSEGDEAETVKMMKQMEKENEEEDPTSEEEEEEFVDANTEMHASTDVESDPIPSHAEKETSPVADAPPVQEAQAETLPADIDHSAVAPVADNAAASETVFSPKRKLRTKHVAKRRKMAKVDENQELDVEGVTAEEDAHLKATVEAVMKDVEGAAEADAAAQAEAQKMADYERRSKAAYEFVLAQKKANVSVAGPVVADAGSVPQQSNVAAPEATSIQSTPKTKATKATVKRSTATRRSPRVKSGSPST